LDPGRTEDTLAQTWRNKLGYQYSPAGPVGRGSGGRVEVEVVVGAGEVEADLLAGVAGALWRGGGERRIGVERRWLTIVDCRN